MKSKGAIKIFAIALALVCLYQLSFTLVASIVENKAENYATVNGEFSPVRKQAYLDSVSNEVVYNLLIDKYTYQEVKERALNLGLDLRGGMHVTMQVDMAQLLLELANNNQDSTFRKALRMAEEEKVTSQENFVDLFYENYSELRPNAQLAPLFSNQKNQESINSSSSNDEVLTYLRQQASDALLTTYDIIGARIDKFGVTQPRRVLNEEAGRVTVELPGVDNPERVRKLLKSTAELEFYRTYNLGEIAEMLQAADKALEASLEAEKGGETDKPAGSGLQGVDNQSTLQPQTQPDTPTGPAPQTSPIASAPGNDDSPSATGTLPGTGDTNKLNTAAADTAAGTQPLLTELFRIVGQPQGNTPVMGYVRIRDTAKINSLLARPEVRENLPADLKMTWAFKPRMEGEFADVLELIALQTEGIEGQEAALAGDVITDARADIEMEGQGGYIVSMTMDSRGAEEWRRITAEAAVDDRSVAIVLDDRAYSWPTVDEEIAGGSSIIRGGFTVEEARDLANILKTGKLPVELNIINEAVVGPSLGQENITSGLWSLVIGLIGVIIFMAVYYSRSGWVANLALLINLFFIIGILASLQAALTLPGMAGIVLTLGMAVDANVLIYERIREELRQGKAMRMAVAEGFRHATSAIIDGNVTTLLTGIILLTFGSGPIYGFAVTLVIGILTSLFTAILISRLIFNWLLEKDKKINFGTKTTNNLFRSSNYDFVGKRKYSYIISGFIILAGIISLFVQGLNYGVDFEGGYSYTVDFEKNINVEEVRNVLTPAFENNTPEVKTFGGDDQVQIVTNYMMDSGNEGADSVVASKLTGALAQLDNPFEVTYSQKQGSAIAHDVRNSALWSIVFGLLAVFLYIVFRFRRWQFAVGATIALMHDVMVTLAIFSIFKDILPFSDVDESLVAALLTIVGFSINDTVVIFDRIREYLNIHTRSPMVSTINSAINTTLSRTIVTALTVLIVVLILFFFGGESVRGFAFAMIIGVIVGCYSTIFVATPLAIDLSGGEQKREIEKF